MYISISASGALSLQESDNFKQFSIQETVPGQAVEALNDIATSAGDDHFWVDANAVIALAPAQGDSDWVDAFWDMLEKSEPYGYSDMQKQTVKAHVESA